MTTSSRNIDVLIANKIAVPSSLTFTTFNGSQFPITPANNTNALLNLSQASEWSNKSFIGSNISVPSIGTYRLDGTVQVTLSGTGTFQDSKSSLRVQIATSGGGVFSQNQIPLVGYNWSGLVSLPLCAEFVTSSTNTTMGFYAALLTNDTGVSWTAFVYGTMRKVNHIL